MPRLIPRLIQKIAAQSEHPNFTNPASLKRQSKKSLHQPLRPKPSYNASDYEQSIILTPGNPVTNKKEYTRHKTRVPKPHVQPQPKLAGNVDPVRRMTDSEATWWANPYLRMLQSPLRKCVMTERLLPTDFLVRLAAIRVSSARIRHKGDASVMVPVMVADGLQHPKFTRRVVGNAIYVHCWKPAIERIQTRRFYNPRALGAVVSPRLTQQIAHQLRLRVVQEFILLAEKLEQFAAKVQKDWNKLKGPIPVTLRRLTYEEWGHMKTTGTAPYEDAVAIIILPPVNKDKVTKKRPEPTTSALPPEDEQHPKDLPPASTLLPATAEQQHEDDLDALADILPTLKIPLYNGISCFPSPSQRRALHSTLNRILAAEGVFNLTRPRGNGKSTKLSHAFLLCSNGKTARLGDPAAAAMALWRLRMYEGEGWTTKP